MLSIGMLWFDDSSDRTLAEKVERATTYYLAKYGAQPDICYISEGASTPSQDRPTRVRVLPLQGILPNHFWIGVAAQKPEEPSRGQN